MSDEKRVKPLKCGLVMPISAMDGYSEAHWVDVRRIIEQALDATEFAVELVSTADDVGIIHKRIVQNLYGNEIVVCDVSGKNPNVMFELGMRLAFDKPAIIIKDDLTNYSFDTSPIEHLTYPRSLHYHEIETFKTSLKGKVENTHVSATTSGEEYTTFLKHFGSFVVAKLDEKPVGRDEYLLESMTDLKREVGALASAVAAMSEKQQRPTSRLAELAGVVATNNSPSAWAVHEETRRVEDLMQRELTKDLLLRRKPSDKK